MIKLLALLLLFSITAQAGSARQYVIERVIERGDMALKFDAATGNLIEVTCNAEKLGKERCEKFTEYAFEYYRGKN